jgi:uncharacterized protein with FMN-binding domain
MKKPLTTLILFFSIILVHAQSSFHGYVVDADTGNPLAYVSIGVVATSVGTVSNEKGQFNLVFNKTVKGADSVKFSMVGYKDVTYKVSDFRKQFSQGKVRVSMKSEKIVMKEVVIKPHKSKKKFLGNTTRSKMFGMGFGTKDVGAEIGVIIPVKNESAFLESFNFFVSHNSYDSLAFRVKLYKLKNGMPDGHILNDNVIIKIGKITGNISVDLTRYNILVSNDFLACIEWLDRKGPPTGRILNISAGLFGSTYIKTASQGNWGVKEGVGVGINVEADITKY